MRSVSVLMVPLALSSAVACAPEGSSAYVSHNVTLNASCMANEDESITTGTYDVGSDNTKITQCSSSYVMNLLVNSNLKANAQDSTGRAEPDVLLITHADIRLMSKDQATLVFGTNGLPNPYRVQTATSLPPTSGTDPETAVLPLEAIPKVYAQKLATAEVSGSKLDSILIEVQVFGTTTGDVDVDFRPFLYPLAICRGCRSACKSEFVGMEADLTTLTSDECNDNRPQDTRWCIDNKC
jgi:hypothetical protein